MNDTTFVPGEQFIQLLATGRDIDEIVGLTNKGRVFAKVAFSDVWQEIGIPSIEVPEVL